MTEVFFNMVWRSPVFRDGKPTGATEEKRGTINFRLYDAIVPQTAANFRELCIGEDGFGYEGSKFDLVLPKFLIRGGSLTHNGTGKSIYGETFADENFTKKHDKAGLLSMANTGPNTNASQFHITMRPMPSLDGQQVVFGEVADEGSMEVIKAIAAMGTPSGRLAHEPIITKCDVR